MEDNSIYNAIIVSLVIGIVIVVTTLVVARPEPERFTELYFNNHQDLDKYSRDGKHEFSFTVHNLEGEDKDYEYEIKVNDRVVRSSSLFVKSEGKVRVNENIQLNIPFDKIKIEVSLPEKNQEIHFWVKYTKHIWMEYEGREDGAVSCLPVNSVEKGDYIIAMLRGSQADGFPIMEVWIDGKKEKEFEVKGPWKEYIVYGPVENGSVIDLAFVNNYGIKEQDELIWDRNIYVKHVRTFNQQIDFIYDKNSWDCEDLKDGDMYWNGALRFRLG